MLSQDSHPPSPPSPFLMEGLRPPPRSPSPPEALTQSLERNKGRSFRRAGNACEIAAGAALNSSIVFALHLLQVHPLGFVVALSASHFYFLATAFGEGRDRFIGNALTGASAGVAALSSLSEPIGEWWEAKQSRETATQEIQKLYAPQQPPLIHEWALVALAALAIALVMAGGGNRQPNKPRIWR